MRNKMLIAGGVGIGLLIIGGFAFNAMEKNKPSDPDANVVDPGDQEPQGDIDVPDEAVSDESVAAPTLIQTLDPFTYKEVQYYEDFAIGWLHVTKTWGDENKKLSEECKSGGCVALNMWGSYEVDIPFISLDNPVLVVDEEKKSAYEAVDILGVGLGSGKVGVGFKDAYYAIYSIDVTLSTGGTFLSPEECKLDLDFIKEEISNLELFEHNFPIAPEADAEFNTGQNQVVFTERLSPENNEFIYKLEGSLPMEMKVSVFREFWLWAGC